MSQTVKSSSTSSLALVAGLASLLVLGALFLATMLEHYQAVDLPYFQFAFLRIGMISLAVAVLTTLLANWLRSAWRAALFGAVVGLAGGAVFVAAAA